MQKNFDINKTALFLKYLARATKTVEGKMFAQQRFQREMALGSRIKTVTKKIEDFINVHETRSLAKLSKKEAKKVLMNDFLKIKDILKKARDAHADPNLLYNLVERAEKIKKRIKNL